MEEEDPPKRPRPPWYPREWMKATKTKQRDIVAASGFAKGYVSQLVKGQKEWSPEALAAFASVMKIEPAELLWPPQKALPRDLQRLIAKMDPADYEKAIRVLRALADREVA